MEPAKVVPYFGTVEKPECHMLYNVTTMATTWRTVATRDTTLLRAQLDTTKCVFRNSTLRISLEAYGERENSPEQRIKDKDKRRAAYHRFYTNMKWGQSQNYHITLDSGVLGLERCTEIICSLY